MNREPDGRLQVADGLFHELEEEGIGYSHWKSNEHLDAALLGKTDLDLLVMSEDRERFTGLLRRRGFVPMRPAPARQIPSVESHLGFDAETGALLHLDVQYSLVMGERLLKNHRLPLEAWLMDDARSQQGVRVPAPERELTLLYVRAMLKTTNRQLLRSRLKGGTPLPERILREARWLAERVEPSALGAAVDASGVDIDAEEVVEFRSRVNSGNLPREYVQERRRSLRHRLRSHERLPRHRAAPKRASLLFRSSPLGKRLGAGIPPRTLAGKAPVVAVVGADGSGKSRLTRDLASWLGRYLDVRHVYFGQPKGGVVWKLLSKPGSLARRRGSDHGRLVRWTESGKWLWLARRRRRLAAMARGRAGEGVVVIAERYPLAEFHQMETPMDGPRLARDEPFAAAEMRTYQDIPPPDLTILLDTDLETLRHRKLDLTVEEHEAKVAAVRSLPPRPGRIVLDAGQPYADVLLDSKSAIWKALREIH